MKRFISIILAVICTVSCIELQPKSDLISENFWKSESDVEAGVVSMYYSLSKALAKGVYDWGELRGGNYYGNQPNGPDQYDIINNIMTSSNSAALWSNLYQTVNRANLVLKYAPSVNMTSAKKSAYLCEGYTIRALCYFYLVRVWGDVPIFVSPVEEYSVDDVFRERQPVSDVFTQILNDLENAELNAQPVSGDVKRTRANIMTVYALMADVYSWLHEYDKVISVMEKVYKISPESSTSSLWRLQSISSTATQSTFTSSWKSIFSKVSEGTSLADVNKERIFYIHYNELENGVNGNTSYFCVGVAKAIPTERLLNSFQTGDKRYSATFTTGETPKISMKFWPEGSTFGTGGTVSDGDIVLYRMSDLVLLHAEALASTSKIGAAVAQLNKIHTRAGLSAYKESDFVSPDAAVLAILKERTAEFVGEGKFWFDLVRTGHASDIGGVSDQQKWLFPVSKTHLDENHKLKQNPGYGTGE